MAFDINAIRNKLAKLQGKQTGTSYWRPQEGADSTVRLLSFKTDDGLPFKEFHFYYNIGKNRGILAPYQFGKPDPIQELITKLRADGSNESKELCKKLYPKMRVYAPVVVRGEEEKGVQIWGFGKTVYSELYTMLADEDVGDITDPYTGRDITVSSIKTAGRQWATTSVRPKMKQSQLSSDEKQMKEWIDSVPETDTLFDLQSYDEISKIVNDWLNGDDTSSDGTSRNFNSSSDSTETSSSSEGSTYKSLDDAFSSLT
jgi:hypothetical protein